MTSLAFVTKEVRVILKFGGIGIGIIIALVMLYRGAIFLMGVFYPKAPPPPKQEFGKLPRIVIPSIGSSSLTYKINTIEGTLPDLKDRINVYRLIQPQPDLLALERTKRNLESAYFIGDHTKITDTLYQWTQQKTGVILQYDIVSKNFTIASNYLTNPSLSSEILLPNATKIKDDLVTYLNLVDANTNDIDFANSGVMYLQVKDNLIMAADNLGSAKYAKIDLKQNPVDEIPIINTTPEESILSFTISYPNNSFTVLEAQYFHYEPDLEQKSDYPLKTAEAAFEDLKEGKASIYNPLNLQEIEITKVDTRYFLNRNTSVYLQPVIVFTGINFSAYVEAIPEESLF